MQEFRGIKRGIFKEIKFLELKYVRNHRDFSPFYFFVVGWRAAVGPIKYRHWHLSLLFNEIVLLNTAYYPDLLIYLLNNPYRIK